MASLADTKQALEGAWSIARRDPDAMSRFDLTVDGFWASFFAAVVAAPGYLLLLVDQYSAQGFGANLGEVALIELWRLRPLIDVHARDRVAQGDVHLVLETGIRLDGIELDRLS